VEIRVQHSNGKISVITVCSGHYHTYQQWDTANRDSFEPIERAASNLDKDMNRYGGKSSTLTMYGIRRPTGPRRERTLLGWLWASPCNQVMMRTR
jgi:hypothetical protein